MQLHSHLIGIKTTMACVVRVHSRNRHHRAHAYAFTAYSLAPSASLANGAMQNDGVLAREPDERLRFVVQGKECGRAGSGSSS